MSDPSPGSSSDGGWCSVRRGERRAQRLAWLGAVAALGLAFARRRRAR